MGKNGTIWHFFVPCFLALGEHCLQMLCLPGFGTHASTHNLPHFRAFPASIRELSHPKCLFSWQTRDCQIVPVLPSHAGELLTTFYSIMPQSLDLSACDKVCVCFAWCVGMCCGRRAGYLCCALCVCVCCNLI